jgi:16S rRNA (cytosine1402-N4)-methyltransferase
MFHKSVLLESFLDIFSSLQIKTFVDGTLGAGGYAEALLRAHPEIERLIGIDQDKNALEIARERLAPFGSKCDLVLGNFSDLGAILKEKKICSVEGVLVDIGVSSMQLDQAERGFSFLRDGPLDMRMNPDAAVTAADIVNGWEERDLGRIFREYGEEKMWRKAASAIVKEREIRPFSTTLQLADCIEKAFKLPPHKIKLHPATLVFQALRITVNQELEKLEQFLPDALKALKKGGRLAVIAFHSLEDRMVKQAFSYYASDKESTSGIAGVFIDKEPQARLITRKPIVADEEEIKLNPRSRSAKMRALEKL